jgi:2-haloacid dehalogenase
MIDAVLFDLGNVLVRWDPRDHYRDRFDSVEDMEAFLAEVCPPAWNHEMDLGKPFAVAIAERQALFPQHAALIAEWRTGWERMLGDEIADMVALLPALAHAGYALHALTNWSAETFPVARRRHGWLQRFEHIVVSGEVGLAKPDPAIFALALEHIARPASQVVFIDDSAINTAAARQLGMATITFTTPAACVDALRALGVRW